MILTLRHCTTAMPQFICTEPRIIGNSPYILMVCFSTHKPHGVEEYYSQNIVRLLEEGGELYIIVNLIRLRNVS